MKTIGRMREYDKSNREDGEVIKLKEEMIAESKVGRHCDGIGRIRDDIGRH